MAPKKPQIRGNIEFSDHMAFAKCPTLARNIGDAIHLEDIEAVGNVEIPAEANVTVVTVLAPKVEVEAVEELVEGEEALEAEGADEEAPAEETSAEKTKEE